MHSLFGLTRSRTDFWFMAKICRGNIPRYCWFQIHICEEETHKTDSKLLLQEISNLWDNPSVISKTMSNQCVTFLPYLSICFGQLRDIKKLMKVNKHIKEDIWYLLSPYTVDLQILNFQLHQVLPIHDLEPRKIETLRITFSSLLKVIGNSLQSLKLSTLKYIFNTYILNVNKYFM